MKDKICALLLAAADFFTDSLAGQLRRRGRSSEILAQVPGVKCHFSHQAWYTVCSVVLT